MVFPRRTQNGCGQPIQLRLNRQNRLTDWSGHRLWSGSPTRRSLFPWILQRGPIQLGKLWPIWRKRAGRRGLCRRATTCEVKVMTDRASVGTVSVFRSELCLGGRVVLCLRTAGSLRRFDEPPFAHFVRIVAHLMMAVFRPECRLKHSHSVAQTLRSGTFWIPEHLQNLPD